MPAPYQLGNQLIWYVRHGTLDVVMHSTVTLTPRGYTIRFSCEQFMELRGYLQTWRFWRGQIPSQ